MSDKIEDANITNKYKDLKNRIEEVEEELKNIKKELKLLKNQRNLKEKSNDEVEEINRLKISEEKGIRENLESTIEELRESKSRLELELSEEKDIRENLESTIEELRESKSRLELELSEEKDIRENLESTIEELRESKSSLKEEIESYKVLFKKYEIILEKLLETNFNQLREKLNLEFSKSNENYLKLACLFYNLDICRIMYEYYSRDIKKESLNEEDKKLINIINEFYLKENMTKWEVFFLPEEKFDKTMMYDLDKPDKNYTKVEEVFCPGVNLKGEKISLRAIVKGK